MRTKLFRVISVALTAVLIASVQAQASADEAIRDAREQVPAKLIGAWKLSVSESKFPSGKPPKASYRFFEYTENGKLLGIYQNVGADGTVAAGNWTVSFDGLWQPYFQRKSGSTPFAMLLGSNPDDRTVGLQVKSKGVITLTAQFVLSQDGEVLTYTTESGGDRTVMVYRRWNLVD